MSRLSFKAATPPLIGRQAEFRYLQDTLNTVLEDGSHRVVFLAGAAGMGKSRLVQEFDQWVGAHAPALAILRDEARPEWQTLPYGLIRVLLTRHLQIQENDPRPTIQEKLERGLGEAADQGDAPQCVSQVGQFLGLLFDPALPPAGLLDDIGQLRDQALACLAAFLQAIATSRPLLLLLEDLHWADESSLDVLERLADILADQPVLIVGTAQSDLLERRPGWMGLSSEWQDGNSPRVLIALQPLDFANSRSMVNEILHQVEEIPEALRAMIVEHAAGNPLAIVEGTQLLIDDDIIVSGWPWRVALERVAAVRIPATLPGVLQARLERLPAAEQAALRHAAMIGLVFWDRAVDFLGKGEPGTAAETLMALQDREIIRGRAVSSWAGASEYVFGHELLWDVVCKSIPGSERRAGHERAAEWLRAGYGAQGAACLGPIGYHLEQAGQAGQAAVYLSRAGEQALRVHACPEAQAFFESALNLLPPKSPARIHLSAQAGRALFLLRRYAAARLRLEESIALARQSGRPVGAAGHIFLGIVARETGDFAAARAHLEEGLALVRPADEVERAHALAELGWVDYRQGDYPAADAHVREGLACAQDIDRPAIQARALSVLAAVIGRQGNLPESRDFFLRSLDLSQQVGDYHGIAAALNNLGWNATLQEDHAAALQYYKKAEDAFARAGNRQGIAYALANQGYTYVSLANYAPARSCYRRALRVALAVGAAPNAVGILGGLAGVLARTGQKERAVELLGLVLSHPARHSDAEADARAVLEFLRGQLLPEAVEAGLVRGQALRLEEVAGQILSERE